VSGLRGRGGFEIDMAWSEGTLERATITSLAGEACQLVYRGQTVALKGRKGARQSFEWRGDKLV
jgi:alpha-L-fucosidase 2